MPTAIPAIAQIAETVTVGHRVRLYRPQMADEIARAVTYVPFWPPAMNSVRPSTTMAARVSQVRGPAATSSVFSRHRSSPTNGTTQLSCSQSEAVRLCLPSSWIAGRNMKITISTLSSMRRARRSAQSSGLPGSSRFTPPG